MQKSFDITIDDQQPINPNNSFAIYRGDNVAFNFTFQRGGISLDVDGATLRVFAKKIGKNGAVDKLSLPLFAEDFVATNTATFNSSQTCGDAGNYILSVLLVSSDDAVITSQCIYFELKENGYAGEYQPSADFRDEVFNASALAQQSSESAQASAINASASEANARDYEQSAQASANNAFASESNANLYSIEASNSSSVALQSKEQAEQFRNETITARDEAILAKEQAQEISDPEKRIGNLQQTKSNRGELWFQGGSSNLNISTLTYNQGDSFSFAIQIKAKLSDVVKGARVFQFNTFNLYFNARLCLYCPSAFGSSVIITTPEQNNKILDGNWHSIICTYDGLTCKLFDEDGLLISASGTIPPVASSYFLIGDNGFVGQMSRIKYFNFDMSADDAPYTIDDYISGKDESPLLLKGTQKVLDSNYQYWVVNNSTNFDLSIDSNADTLIATCKASNTYLTISDYGRSGLKAGDVVTVSWSSIITPAGISVSSTDIFVTGNVRYPVVNGGTFINAVDSSYMMFRVSFNTKVEVGDTITIKGLRIRVNGALLSLEDYTFNGKVFDTSGNNNTATIIGAVKGTRDNAVEQMYQAFASRIGNLTE